MATSGTIGITASLSGAATGQRTIQFTIPITAGVDASTVHALSSGANTITPPSGATEALIFGPNTAFPQPNPLSTVTLTLKGVTGDTGISIAANYPTLLSFGTLPATFVLTASGSATVEIFWA